MGSDHHRRRSIQFLRDVGVNVLANLVAALVIYLLGAALGLFPRSSEAVGVALMGLGAAAIYLLTFVGEAGNDFYRRELSAAGSTIVVGALLIIYGVTQSQGDRTTWWVCISLGSISALVGAWGVYSILKKMKVRQNEERRLKGLHWYEP